MSLIRFSHFWGILFDSQCALETGGQLAFLPFLAEVSFHVSFILKDAVPMPCVSPAELESEHDHTMLILGRKHSQRQPSFGRAVLQAFLYSKTLLLSLTHTWGHQPVSGQITGPGMEHFQILCNVMQKTKEGDSPNENFNYLKQLRNKMILGLIVYSRIGL